MAPVVEEPKAPRDGCSTEETGRRLEMADGGRGGRRSSNEAEEASGHGHGSSRLLAGEVWRCGLTAPVRGGQMRGVVGGGGRRRAVGAGEGERRRRGQGRGHQRQGQRDGDGAGTARRWSAAALRGGVGRKAGEAGAGGWIGTWMDKKEGREKNK
jgi:hypothetical protein